MKRTFQNLCPFDRWAWVLTGLFFLMQMALCTALISFSFGRPLF